MPIGFQILSDDGPDKIQGDRFCVFFCRVRSIHNLASIVTAATAVSWKVVVTSGAEVQDHRDSVVMKRAALRAASGFGALRRLPHSGLTGNLMRRSRMRETVSASSW
jgi:hypothetical protein